MLNRIGKSLAVIIVCVCAAGAFGDVVIDTVAVGNPGNAGELSGFGAGGFGPDRVCGAVGYTYNIGTYEVTAGQYTAFLNAVASSDGYGLYNTSMELIGSGCQIQRSGSDGNYTYSVASDWADRPVNYVSYWDACRFANWMHNGQPTGASGPGTTETGAYTLGGYNGTDGSEIVRNTDWNWAVTSEDEWYKAAYHKNDGETGNYWDYSTGSDETPNNGNPEGDTGNSANFFDNDGYTVGYPYYRTTVGYFGLSDSPYGTFDQGGNVWEWNESVVGNMSTASRGRRGGAFAQTDSQLLAAYRYDRSPTDEDHYTGFRLAQVPEPGTMALWVLGAVGILVRRRGLKG